MECLARTRATISDDSFAPGHEEIPRQLDIKTSSCLGNILKLEMYPRQIIVIAYLIKQIGCSSVLQN